MHIFLVFLKCYEIKIVTNLNKAELEEMKKQGHDQATKEYEKKLKELNEQKIKAVGDGNVEEYTKIDKEVEQLEKPVEPKKQQKETPVFVDWSSKNAWYQEDDDMTQFAEFVATKIERAGKTEAEFLEEVSKRVKKTFPDKFKNPNREEESKTDTGHSGGGGKKKTGSDLPPEAKRANPNPSDFEA